MNWLVSNKKFDKKVIILILGDLTADLTINNEKLENERKYLKNELKKLEH